MRLYRQQRLGDCGPVCQRMAEALGEPAPSTGHPPPLQPDGHALASIGPGEVHLVLGHDGTSGDRHEPCINVLQIPQVAWSARARARCDRSPVQAVQYHAKFHRESSPTAAAGRIARRENPAVGRRGAETCRGRPDRRRSVHRRRRHANGLVQQRERPRLLPHPELRRVRKPERRRFHAAARHARARGCPGGPAGRPAATAQQRGRDDCRRVPDGYAGELHLSGGAALGAATPGTWARAARS